MVSFFSKNLVNTGRQTEVDLLRGFTAIDMIICHVGLYLGNPENIGLYTFCDICGSEFAAPIFMALMGMSILYSRHQEPIDFLKRGVTIFIIGYILNFFRSILPLLILGKVDEWASIEAFFVVDIMQLAGLSFMFLALLKKLKFPPLAVLITSIAMVLIDQFIMFPENLTIKNEVLIGLINLFCPITTWSCFPFLTWFFFPAFGLCFGTLLRRCINKKGFYTGLLIIGFLGVLTVYGTFHFLYPDYTSYYWGHNFYYMGLKNVFLTCAFIVFGLSFWFFAQKIFPQFAKQFLTFLSKNLNMFYLISWIIISVLIHVQALLDFTLSVLVVIILMVVVIALCALFTLLFIKIKAKENETKNNQ